MRRNNRFKKELDKTQTKITNFFSKPQSDSSNNQNSSQATPSTSRTVNKRFSSRPKWIDDGDYTDIEILPPPPETPKELIDITSSSSENEDNGVVRNLNGPIKSEPASPTSNEERVASSVHEHGALMISDDVSSSRRDELSPSVDLEDTQIVRSRMECQEKDNSVVASSSSPFHGSDSSGDEILSQIDVDEIIRSSQSSLNSVNDGSQGDPRSVSPSILSTPNKENQEQDLPRTLSLSSLQSDEKKFKSPRKVSPKSQLNKFSPIRHLRVKRSSSEASLDSTSTSIPGVTSPSQTRKSQNGFTREHSQSPTKRKLDFTSSTTTGGGQARYFLRNFLTILTEVIYDKFHTHLIHEEDHQMVQHFVALSIDAQHLYVRLFQRKWYWKPITKLKNNNKELPDDLSDACSELQSRGFLDQISSSNCGSLEDVLDTLDLSKLASLSKKLKLNPPKKTKEALKSALLSTRKTQKTLTSARCEGSDVILKHALTELGPAFRISRQSKLMFSRLFLLHSPPQYWEVENDQASNQLLIVLLNQMGQMNYPSYTIHKSTIIYPTRDHLIQFHDAFSLHSNLVAFSEGKAWTDVVDLATQARVSLQNILIDKDTKEHDARLPSFLKIYTAGTALAHTLWLGVDGYQKLKRFKEANELIQFILGQSIYLMNYRGRWWERLVINSETHLKKSKDDVRGLLEEALKDEYLKENHRFALSQRLEKVKATLEKKSKKNVATAKTRTKKKVVRKTSTRRKQYVDESGSEDVSDVEDVAELREANRGCRSDEAETQVQEGNDMASNGLKTLSLKKEVPTRTITGEKMDQGPGAKGKSVFLSRKDSTGCHQIGSVEQFVIHYYLEQHGYTCGIHGEGSTVATIYGILFWDVIFADGFPDAFHHRYQSFPLDFHFEDFYQRRKHLIEDKLILIRSVLAMEDLLGVVDEIWTTHEKKLSIVNWAMFEDDIDKLKSLMKAMGSKMIADICERLAKNYRHYSSGFPDLVVWRDKYEESDIFGDEKDSSCDSYQPVPKSNGKVLFVEVKGPGDHLSDKQQLWLDFLLENGIPAEVCLVKAVSNKRIRLDR